jgi:hypothetical protein
MPARFIWFGVFAILAAFVWNSPAAAQNTVANQSFTLAPGGKATIDFESFCIDYGKRFPNQVGLPPSNVADPALVGALNNALNKGYTGNNAREVQLAIWKARGATAAPQPSGIGNEISQDLQQPAPPQGATSVIDAIKSNQIKLTAGSWGGIGEKITINGNEDFYQGRGQLQVENTSGQQLTLFMPIGTVFPAPSPEFQSMAGYATNVSVNNPAPTQVQSLPETGFTDQVAEHMLWIVLYGIAVVGSGIFIRRYYAQA